LARRATLIQALRALPSTKGKVALFAGPYEILSPYTGAAGGTHMQAMAKAYALLGYDAGALMPAEAAALRQAGAAMPKTFVTLGPTPDVATMRIGDIPVGVVRFPALANAEATVPAELADRTAAAAAALRGKVRLIVGISGWGATDEAAFVRAHPGAVDVLLGSGPGLGSAGTAVGDGKTLWARAYSQGKTVNRLDLFALPDTDRFVWAPQTGYRAEVISLDDQYAAAPEVQKLF